jgi:hypothetical protein
VQRPFRFLSVLQPMIYKLPAGIKRRVLFAWFNRRLPRFGRPMTFNDKVNWRILKDRRDLLEWTCDKLLMKDYAAKSACLGLRIPRTLWSGTDLNELLTIELPACWILKPNHRSGLVYFGSGRPDVLELAEITKAWLSTLESRDKGEWAYSRARPMLLVEEMLATPTAPPADYKFFVFSGKVAVIQMDIDRHSDHKRRLYSPGWSPLEVVYGPHELAHVASRPAGLHQMLAIATELGQPFDFIRIDLYNVNGEIYLGEVTPYPAGGLDRFMPDAFDFDLGKCWILPEL